MSAPQQVWEFSRAFLGGWDGQIVVLKVFMDETGIHDDAEVVAVGGYIGRPKEWRAWTKDWNRAKRPIRVFHAADCANFYGEFEGWDKGRRDPYVAALLPVLPAHDLAGIVIGVELKVMEAAFDGSPELRTMFGKPYTACFQWAISTIMEYAAEHGLGERMAFVHEVNDFKGDALRAFEYVKRNRNPKGITMTLSFGGKEDYPPLQAADILAYEGGKFLKNPLGPYRRSWTALDPDERIMAKGYTKENMSELTSLLSEYRERLLAYGWDGRVVP